MNINYENEYFNKIYDEIKEIEKSNNLKEILMEDIKINDLVCIFFSPDSQKNINILYPKIGKVVSIEDEINIDPFTDKKIKLKKINIINLNNNINLINKIILSNNIIWDNIKQFLEIENLLHESVSYYGSSLGYTYYIYKINK
jgi:hypothetical protein